MKAITCTELLFSYGLRLARCFPTHNRLRSNSDNCYDRNARTNGKFYRVTDYDTLESVFKEIDQLEKAEVKSKLRHDPKRRAIDD